MTQPDTSADLRAEMVRQIVDSGHATNPRVKGVLEHVRREAFLPDVPLADVYRPRHCDLPGVYAGRSIDPVTVAAMLDQLDVHPGDHVLHIGTGSGYTTALLAELAHPGHVVTVDRSNNITTAARVALQSLGYDQVEVITGDGNHGAPGRRQFDRIIVTASSYDLPGAWTRQLAPHGRIVVPLRFRGTSRSVAFHHHDGVLRARDSQPCSLARMLGADHDLPRTSLIGPRGQLAITWDHDLRQFADRAGLAEPESYSNTDQTWSHVVVRQDDPLDKLWLHLAATERAVVGLAATKPTTGVPELAFPEATPAIIANETIAYLTRQEIPAADDGVRRYRLGAASFGPFAARLAASFVDRIRDWAAQRHAHPTITVYPAGVAALPPGQYVQRPGNSFLLQPTLTT